MNRGGIHLVAAAIVSVVALSGGAHAQAPDATQTLVLQDGWNLVSVQVGSAPIPMAEFRNAFSDSTQVAEVWGYAPSGSAVAPGRWDFNKESLANLPGLVNDLTHIEQGKGYWIRIANGTTTATFTKPAWSGAVDLQPGWNLVGFPGLSFGENEEQVLSDLFGEHFDRIQQVWTFDPAATRFIGYDDSAVPRLTDLTGVEAGRGYWLYSVAESALDLAPMPLVRLPPDGDASPPEDVKPYILGSADDAVFGGLEVRYVDPDGDDDRYDYNDNGIIDDTTTQDTILFERTAGTATISISNEGSGSLTWTLENDVPWLFTVPPNEKDYENNAGRPKTASGTVSSEDDVITLYADRRGKSPGTLGPETITLWVGDVPKVITVYAEVADIAGDWSGFATTTRVNGSEVSLGRVGLHLNAFFDDGETEEDGFRAVMDREKAILFPRDVFLEGVFYSDNSFQLNTNFEMPPGDRNAPPFGTFPGEAGDRDFNGDGDVDVMNPFPYGIRREVTLLGTRISPDRLEGTYIESIRGMLPPLSNNSLINDVNEFRDEVFKQTSQPIMIEGDFVLNRETFEPSKRSIFNETSVVNTGLGGNESQGITLTIPVDTSFSVTEVALNLDLVFPEPEFLQIILFAPNQNRSYVVHQFGDPALPDEEILIPEEPENEIFKDTEGSGSWTLQVDWDTSERGVLTSWGLNIGGESTYQVSGQVVDSDGPLENVSLRLEGSVRGRSPIVSADGSYTFTGLTENDYTLIASKPGYHEKAVPFFIRDADVVLADIELIPLALDLTEPELQAAPLIGYQPLTTVLTLLKPASVEVDTIEWKIDFPGVENDVELASGPLIGPDGDLSFIEHTFEEAGLFTITATLGNDGMAVGDPLSSEITVLRARREDGATGPQVVLAGFTGALGARSDADADMGVEPPVEVTVTSETAQVSTLDGEGNPQTTSFSTATATVYQESKWDSGTFDLDRVPARNSDSPFSSALEDTDFFGQSYVYRARNGPVAPFDPPIELFSAYNRGVSLPPGGIPAIDDHQGSFKAYTIPQGTTKPTRFRMAVSLGGAVFSPEPQSLGGVTIHPGRTILPPTN